MKENIEISIAVRPATREDFYRDQKILFGQPYILKSQSFPGMWSKMRGLTIDEIKSGQFKEWLEAEIVYVPVSAMDVTTYTPQAHAVH